MTSEQLAFIQLAIDKLKEWKVKSPYYLLQEDGTLEEIYSDQIGVEGDRYSLCKMQ